MLLAIIERPCCPAFHPERGQLRFWFFMKAAREKKERDKLKKTFAKERKNLRQLVKVSANSPLAHHIVSHYFSTSSTAFSYIPVFNFKVRLKRNANLILRITIFSSIPKMTWCKN